MSTPSWLRIRESRSPRTPRRPSHRSHRPLLERLEDRLAPAVKAAPSLATLAGVSCACGTLNDIDARFCKSCGAKLATAGSAT